MTVTNTEGSRSAGHDCYKTEKSRSAGHGLLHGQKCPGLLVMTVPRAERSWYCWS